MLASMLFFQANKENPKFQLILGKFLRKEITCLKCGNIIHTYEEKETDARIATLIVAGCLGLERIWVG